VYFLSGIPDETFQVESVSDSGGKTRISGILAALLRLSPFGKTYQRSAKRNLQFRFEHH
jgi:hypothetical protein